MAPVRPLLLLLGSCQDYQLSGAREDSSAFQVPADTAGGAPVDTGPPPGDTGESSADTAVDEVCHNIDLAPARAWAGAPTCREYDGFETWKMEIELEAQPGGNPEWSFLSMPAVLPVAGSSERVVFQLDGESTVLVDPSTGLVELELLTGYTDAKGVSGANDQVEGATWIGATTGWSNYTSSTAVTSVTDPSTVLHSGMLPFAMDASLADLDRDGFPDFVLNGGILSTNGASLDEFTTGGLAKNIALADLDADGMPEVLGKGGIWWWEEGALSPWSQVFEEGGSFEGGVVERDDGLFAFGTDTHTLFIATTEGTITWQRNVVEDDIDMGWVNQPIAIGDATGDGRPDLCAFIDHTVSLTDLDGEEVWATDDHLSLAGGCAMADLDADGVHEVIAWGIGGLFILDGATGVHLAERTDIQTWSAFNPPLVADVDGDGGAEIVLTGERVADEGCCHQDRLFILGPAAGRWAKTRPVWNQWGYDVTSIRDDGTIVSFPFPNWQTYNSYRAQPAHDGAHPDLQVAATDACATECAPGGTIRLAVQVSNSGSVEASPGAVVRLLTWTMDGGLREVASATMADALGPDQSAAGIELTLPYEDWGDRQVLEVVGSDGDECDWLNNREELAIPEPCG